MKAPRPQSWLELGLAEDRAVGTSETLKGPRTVLGGWSELWPLDPASHKAPHLLEVDVEVPGI